MAQTTVTAAGLLDPATLHQLVTIPLTTEPVFAQVSTPVMLASHELRVPRVTADPVAQFVGEGEEIPLSSATVDEIVIRPAKIAALDSITRETLADSTTARSEFGRAMVRSIGVAGDKAFFGASTDPDNPTSLADVVGVTTVPAGTTWANLDAFADAVGVVEGAGATVTHWVANPADAGELRKLKSSTGSNSPLLATDPAAGARRLVEGAPVIDPAVYDTSPIAYDWDQTSGLQEAARSVITKAKTATEAAISDQSLGARVGEFRDSVEDWLTEIAQYGAELLLLAMTEPMVAQIMGEAEPVDEDEIAEAQLTGIPPIPDKPYEWPAERTPETVFQLVQMKIRAGSTAAPNKLEMQETWTKALPLLQNMIQVIMQVDASGGDSTPFRELVKETAARFDDSLDVERFLPPKPPQQPAIPQIPGMQPGMPMPGGIPGQPTLQ